MFNFLPIGGSKAALIKKITKYEEALHNPESVSDRIKAFLGTTMTGSSDDRPPITAHYKRTFNAVDKFDTFMGHIKYPHKIPNIEVLCLINFVRLGIVNSYTLLQTLQAIKDIDQEQGIKSFTRQLWAMLREEYE